MSFEVDLPSLHRASDDLETLGSTVVYAYNPANNYLDVDGGNLLGRIGGELSTIQDNLTEAYRPYGAAEKCLYGVGARLWGMAIDYEDVDADQA